MSLHGESVKVECCNFVMVTFEVTEIIRLKSAFLQLKSTSSELDQKNILKEIVSITSTFIVEGHNSEAIECILHLFTKYSSKRILKKCLQDHVVENKLIQTIIEGATRTIKETVNSSKTINLSFCIEFLNFIYIVQNLPGFNYERVINGLFPIWCIIYDAFVYKSKSNFEDVTCLAEMMFVINATLKQMLTVFVKDGSYIKIVSEHYCEKLILLSHYVIMHEKVQFDIKTKAGLILTHSFFSLPERILNDFKYKDCIPLELLEKYSDGNKLIFLNSKLEIFTECEHQVILYGSLLNIVPKRKLCDLTIDGSILLCLLYDGLLDCAGRSTNIPHLIIEISRTLAVISKHLRDIPPSLLQSIFSNGISFVSSHIEHFIDSVRNYAKLFFIELIIVAAQQHQKGSTELSDMLLDVIKQAGDTHTIKFVTLEYMALHISCSFLLKKFSNVVDEILKVVSEPTMIDQVCKCYTSMMEVHFKEVKTEVWIIIWLIPPIRLLTKYDRHLDICQKIITKAFRLHPPVLRRIFPNSYVGNVQECVVLLKCLRYARQNSIEVLMDTPENTALYWRGLIDQEKLTTFMTHQVDEIRIAALAAMVESQKSTEIFLECELNYLYKFLRYNITSQIPHVRKEITSYYSKALTRFNAGSHVIARNLSYLKKLVDKGPVSEETIATLTVYMELEESYEKFTRNLTKYLISNLTFDSNFPRRSVSLELLICIQSLLPAEQWQSLWSEDDVKNCHSILFDTYESNKKMATVLLKNLPAAAMGFTNVEFTFKYMQRCLTLALAIKPTKTLSAAYLLHVCAQSPYFYDMVQYSNQKQPKQNYHPPLDMLVILTGKLITQINLEAGVTNTKVANYGLIQSIRHILNTNELKNHKEYSDLFKHIVNICLKLKKSLMPIVCNPSPEGYLPDSIETINENDETAKAQLLVVIAWRTIKEITLLLAEMVRRTVSAEAIFEMLSTNVITKLGEFFVEIFTTSKHKGVFEQAFISFSVFCRSLWISSKPELNRLPLIWLDDVLMLCTGKKQSDTLCATRRSAGLPFLIMAIFSSQQVFNKSKFNSSISLLIQACNNLEPSNNEYRMHCMNVLRALFRCSRLGEMVTEYNAQGVIIAITGFQSTTWGIRNSATLLYAALITRIFGVQRTQDSEDLSIKNRLTFKVFSLRYRELLEFLLKTLTTESNKTDSLLLHPVLLILNRLYPSYNEEYDKQMVAYIPHLLTCLSNSGSWTRSLAACAMISFIQKDEVAALLDTLFHKIEASKINDNETHGCLLLIISILKSDYSVDVVPISNYVQMTLDVLKLVGKKYSHMTAATYLELIMLILIKYPNYEDLKTLKNIVKILSRQITENILATTSLGKYSQWRMSLLLYIIINKFEENELTYSTVTNQIMCQLYGHELQMKIFCLNFLICLHQLKTGTKHSLYQLEELEIPPDIMELCNSFDRSSITKILTQTHQYLKYFLTEEIKHQHYIRKEDQVLIFLLLNYYPCVTKYLNLNKQDTLNTLIELCGCDNEELISAVVSCISTFLLQIDYSVLKYDKLIKALAESSSPAASDFRRLAVCDLLSKNYILYCNEESILTGDELQMVLNMVMVLLEDDELMVRNAMSEFATTLKVKITLNSDSEKQTHSGQKCEMMAEKAREDLLMLSSIILPKHRAICFLFSWCCRHFPDNSIHDLSEIFERGELNSYAENVAFMEFCGEILHKLLWTLEGGINYEDKSIFIEEHTLLVTTNLLDSLTRHPSPMMLHKTKVSVICALKSTVKFLERYEINKKFLDEFRTYLNETIIGYLTKHIEHTDLISVKWIIRNIYEPVLKREETVLV